MTLRKDSSLQMNPLNQINTIQPAYLGMTYLIPPEVSFLAIMKKGFYLLQEELSEFFLCQSNKQIIHDFFRWIDR
jgi:hypothetical protein